MYIEIMLRLTTTGSEERRMLQFPGIYETNFFLKKIPRVPHENAYEDFVSTLLGTLGFQIYGELISQLLGAMATSHMMQRL